MKKNILKVLGLILLIAAGVFVYRMQLNNPQKIEETNKGVEKITDLVLTSVSGTVTAITPSKITLQTTILKNDANGYGVPTTETWSMAMNGSTTFESPTKKLSDIKTGSNVSVYYYSKSGESVDGLFASKVRLK
jgi:preprotein translocase subunit YajC